MSFTPEITNVTISFSILLDPFFSKSKADKDIPLRMDVSIGNDGDILIREYVVDEERAADECEVGYGLYNSLKELKSAELEFNPAQLIEKWGKENYSLSYWYYMGNPDCDGPEEPDEHEIIISKDYSSAVSIMPDVKEFIMEIEKSGFEKVLEIPFTVLDMDDNPPMEMHDVFYAYFLRKYGIKSVNGGNFFYEWVPNNLENAYLYTSSGGYEKIDNQMIWVGEHDCRSNIIGYILGLAEHGAFVTPWKSKSAIFRPKFVHYGDHHTSYKEPWDVGYNMYKDACKNQGRERYNMLPDYVKVAMGDKNAG
jgi:hypothetical protein